MPVGYVCKVITEMCMHMGWYVHMSFYMSGENTCRSNFVA